MAEALERATSLPWFMSGSRAIDRLLGGGYRAGTVTELFGRSNTGKSQLAMQALMTVSHAGLNSLYIDTEGSFRPERIEGIAKAREWDPGEILRRIAYIRAADSTQQMEVIRRIHSGQDASSYSLVAIDTLTKNFTLDYPGNMNMPRRQGALDVHLSEIGRDAFLNGRAYVLANRVVYSQDREEDHVGGRTVSQMVHESIHLTRDGDRIRATLMGEEEKSEMGGIGATGFD